jgi:hypothetical protein
MSTLAPILQSFFTDRLQRQRQASLHTIAAYRDAIKHEGARNQWRPFLDRRSSADHPPDGVRHVRRSSVTNVPSVVRTCQNSGFALPSDHTRPAARPGSSSP